MQRLFRPRLDRNTPEARARRPRRSRPGLESLEGRQLLSLGPELAGNAVAADSQSLPVTASTPDGRSVTAWLDRTSGNERIEFRLFDASGNPVTSDIAVQASGGNVSDPAVAMDHFGKFVVTWTQSVPGQETNILAQRFNAIGAPIGSVITVAGTTRVESQSDVAMDRFGNFVVAYGSASFSGDVDVVAKRYRSDGSFQGTVDTQSGTSFPSYDEIRPSVAMAADGRFAIAYEYFSKGDSAHSKIWTMTYHDTGALVRGMDVAGSSVDDVEDPDIAMNDFGDVVVAYEKLIGGPGGDHDIKARRISAGGVVSGEIHVFGTVDDEQDPKVAMNRTGSSFVVSYDSVGGGRRVGVAEFNSSNVRTLLPTIEGAANPAISMGANGQYQLAYDRRIGTDTNVFRRRGNGSTS